MELRGSKVAIILGILIILLIALLIYRGSSTGKAGESTLAAPTGLTLEDVCVNCDPNSPSICFKGQPCCECGSCLDNTVPCEPADMT